jgi:hypothetical protein
MSRSIELLFALVILVRVGEHWRAEFTRVRIDAARLERVLLDGTREMCVAIIDTIDRKVRL